MRRLALQLPLLGLLGCGTVSDWGRSSAGLFPHAEGYPEHGSDWLSKGAAACEDCHQPGREAPACADCHADYPHEAGWSHAAALGSLAAVPPACAACHEAEGSVAATWGCSSCHQTWPHPAGWTEAGGHGTAAMARGSVVAACGNCHGQGGFTEDAASWAAAAGCGQCHPSWPHAAGFAAPEHHGAAWTEGQDCASCHATEPTAGALGTAALTGGTAGVACARCHATFPHPADWAREHTATAAQLGEPTCLRCHAAGDGPPLQTAACAPACHGSAP